MLAGRSSKDAVVGRQTWADRKVGWDVGLSFDLSQ